MNENVFFHNPEFDDFAADYDSALNQGLAVSGEQKEYFSRGRIAWLEKCLQSLHYRPQTVLDFGCGTGSAVPAFLAMMDVESIIGVDPSPKSIGIAQQSYGSERASFATMAEFHPSEDIGLAFCNGVFHHIPIETRLNAARFVRQSLCSGGLFSFWENNPWNPGTRYVMSRIPFDRNAIPVTCRQACRLLRAAGFRILRVDFLFVFPRVLKHFRIFEPALSKLPFGAQYQVLCRKP